MNTEHHDELTGVVERFLFQNQQTGYVVLVLQMQNDHSTIVTGYLPNIQPGEQIDLLGTWVTHTKFGRQFEAKTCIKQLPTTIVGLKKYLGSGLIKGIGKTYAEKLVTYFGASVLEVIDKYPERLTEVAGIGGKRAETIKHAWQDQKEISNIMIFLQDKDVSPSLAIKIYKKYGQASIAAVTENPYRLAEDIWGVGFKSADAIAQKIGFAPNSVNRVKAGLIFAITQATQQGHLYLELADLRAKTLELLELTQDAESIIKTALHDLYNTEKIKLISHQEQHFITLPQYYFSEQGIAHKINALLAHNVSLDFDISTIYDQLRTEVPGTITLNEDQQHGIMTCLQHKITIITGGPGTGKTTMIKKLLSILDEYAVSYKLAAPTGRAAKRMTEGTGRYALTLHRLLEFDVSSMSFTHNEYNALKTQFLIVDEASMIDVFLAHALLKAVPLNAHIIFLGDVDQLPAVGAGNFLNDLIASNSVSCIRLIKIFRQAQDSLIIVNAHRVNHGEFPTSNIPDTRKDFIFIKEQNPEQLKTHLEQIITKGLRKFGLTADDVAVLVPMNRGIIGTHKLNQDLQLMLNPTTTEQQIMYSGTLFKIHDKVMQIRNNYDKSVFNGDIGIIETIDNEEQIVTVRYFERLVPYEFSELDELVLAYAISIHKSQGSEYPAVIIPIFMQHFMLLQRNLLYTAITRAKKLCICIGEPKAIAVAIKNNKSIARKTFLQELLKNSISCR